MQFPIGLIYNERNDNLASENVYNDLASSQCMDLGLKEVILYPSRSIQYHDGEQPCTSIQKFKNDNVPFRMCIDSLLDSNWIERSFLNISRR
jgi:hypothetical protein